MNHFEYRGGQLVCEGIPLSRIAEEVGTPTYVYSTATLQRHYRVFREALSAHPAIGEPFVTYAVKANPNVSVLRTLALAGAGADTVSEGEIRRALAAGVPPERIVFSGVGKTAAELAFALEAGVAEINVESPPEFDLIESIAATSGRVARIAIRVNPNIGAGAHAKISTGKAEDKFGVSASEAERLYARAAASPHLEPLGLAVHIGSQITEFSGMRAAFRKLRELVEDLRAAGHAVRRLDLGGGLGVPYFNQPDPPSPAEFAQMTAEVIGNLGVELAFEPGRLIAANAGVLLSRVIHVHERPEGQRFLVLDAAMNDLIRPAMYESFHDIRPVAEPAAGAELRPYDVVGPICESGDTFTRGRRLPPLASGDLVAFMTAGAYGAAMSSEYNSRLLVAETLVDGDRYAVIRPRPTYDDMLAREPLAPWL
jgi:diaminopimelate decarboxylase